MANNSKPDHILYIIVPGAKPEDKKQWVRFGACWKAAKGFSIKIEPAFTLFPPFNDLSLGIAMMPVDDEEDSDESGRNSQRRQRR
jgi:hypothetical protein